VPRGAAGQQHAAGDAFFVADGGGAHGARLSAFGQYDAFVGLAGGLHHVVAELRGRYAVAAGFRQISGVFRLGGAAQIRQFQEFGGFRIVGNHAGKHHVAAGEGLLGGGHAARAFGRMVAAHGKHHRRVKRQRQLDVLR